MCRYIRYCVNDDKLTGDNVFDVSRASILGNPFTHIKTKKTKALYVVSSRDEAIDLYGGYFDMMYKKNASFKDAVDRIYEASKTNDEVYIGCYCRTDERCHGDVVIEKLTNMAVRDAIINEARKTNDKENG